MVTLSLAGRDALHTKMEQSVRDGVAFSLAVLDIDNFLSINQDFGPEVGDAVLTVLARFTGEAATAANGEAFRVSGDEFAVLMPETPLEQAFLKMERLRETVEKSISEFGVPDGRPVTITIGVAQYPREGKDAQSIAIAADVALSAAKEQGRNAVRLPMNEEMVLKSCYYPATDVRRLKALAERLNKKESLLLRESLSDLIRKYDR